MKSIKKKAQSLVEYGLILALVAIVAIAALQVLGKHVNEAAVKSGENIENTGKNAAKTYCETTLGSDYTWDEANNVCKKNK